MNIQPEDIIDCYGKHRIDCTGKDRCPRRKDCEWGSACLSAANEQADNIHYQRANISLSNMIFDEDFLQRQGCSLERSEQVEQITASAMEPEEQPENVLLGDRDFSREEYEAVCSALEEVSKLYFDTPTAFDCLMRKLYKGQKQSDVARERGVKRQAVNKRLLHELGIAQKRSGFQEQRERELENAKKEYQKTTEELRLKDKFLASLNERDWMIYKKAFVDGESRNVIAAELKIGTATVSRVIQFLRSKLLNGDTIKRGRKRKK